MSWYYQPSVLLPSSPNETRFDNDNIAFCCHSSLRLPMLRSLSSLLPSCTVSAWITYLGQWQLPVICVKLAQGYLVTPNAAAAWAQWLQQPARPAGCKLGDEDTLAGSANVVTYCQAVPGVNSDVRLIGTQGLSTSCLQAIFICGCLCGRRTE